MGFAVDCSLIVSFRKAPPTSSLGWMVLRLMHVICFTLWQFVATDIYKHHLFRAIHDHLWVCIDCILWVCILNFLYQPFSQLWCRASDAESAELRVIFAFSPWPWEPFQNSFAALRSPALRWQCRAQHFRKRTSNLQSSKLLSNLCQCRGWRWRESHWAKWDTRIPSTSFLAEFLLHRVFSVFLPFAPSAGLPRIRRRKEGTIRAGLVWAAFGSFRHRVLVRVLWLGCCHSFFLFIEWQASMVESTQQDRVTIYLKNVLLFSDTASNSCANLIELQVCGTFPPLKGWRHCFSSYLADPTDTLAKTVGFSVFTH